MLVKGQKLKASILGFIECTVWGLVISSVITTLGNNIFLLFFYCFGYAVGLYLGSTIENKIAIGTSNLQLVVNEKNTKKIITYLKENGKGFTIFEGKGAKETVNMIFIVAPRKEVKELMKDIRNICDNQVFEVSSEVSKFAGGYGVNR